MTDVKALSIKPPVELCLKCENCRHQILFSIDSLFAPIPDCCGYSGWIFSEREKIKHKIRQLKESIIELKVVLKDELNDAQREKIEFEIQKAQSIVNSYVQYGALDW